jgi:hypothetical protein
MTRFASVAAFALLMALPLEAQAPKGWMVRADRSTNATDPDAAGSIKFTAQGSSLLAVNPQAAVYWNPANSATGNYTLRGRFTLLKPSDHTNYYGLVFGGSDLGGPKQTYLYFLVAQDGSWLVKQRAGDTRTNDIGSGPHASVRKPGADGTSVNDLEVRVAADKVDYVVNGTVVHSTPKTGAAAQTNGLYGIRVNHRLEVKIDNFGLGK